MRRTQHSYSLVFLLCLCLLGCATNSSQRKHHKEIRQILNTGQDENVGDAVTALESVAQSFQMEGLSEEQLEQVAKELREDEDAQSAVLAISDALEGKNVSVKYSPATGKRYSADMEYCPETGVKLLLVE